MYADENVDLTIHPLRDPGRPGDGHSRVVRYGTGKTRYPCYVQGDLSRLLSCVGEFVGGKRKRSSSGIPGRYLPEDRTKTRTLLLLLPLSLYGGRDMTIMLRSEWSLERRLVRKLTLGEVSCWNPPPKTGVLSTSLVPRR